MDKPTTREFEVKLEMVDGNGNVVGSTNDTFSAVDAMGAEAAAVDAWTQREPRYTYRPLLTMEVM